MNFSDAIRSCIHKWLTVQGRASRSEFWWFQLFYIILFLALSAVTKAIGPLAIVALIVYLYLMIVQITVSIRRLHDINRSGWWLLIGLIPIIGGLVLLYFYVQPSNPGANQFGTL